MPSSSGLTAAAGPTSSDARSSAPAPAKSPLEQLPHDAECEVRLKFRRAGAQNVVAKLFRPSARRLNERSFADADANLDYEDATAAS